ncbi:MAG: thiol peroxidase [Cloacibacterium sp.]|jgi:thiol peroxidase|nr:thiol peroxidase [Cloacibacterium sp.]
MAQITLKGNPINTIGELPKIGETAKEFTLVASDLTEKKLSDFKGIKVVLNVFPSIDTGICAASARKFNEEVSALENTVILNISKDLPFALTRFCAAEGLEKVINLSDFRGNFADDYQLKITNGPLQGLASRAVIVLDENGTVVYTEQVPEIAQEPDYEAALKAVK